MTINGIGERAGNASLEEVRVTLISIGGTYCEAKAKKLSRTE